jgi:xylulokinase
MGAYALGIDFGTGGAKAAIVDEHGDVRGYAFEEFPLIHEHPGWSEHDAHRYWQATCRLVRAVVAQAGVRSDAIRGVAVSSALPSLVMVDEAHEPIERAYNLMDRRATAEVRWLQESIGDDRIFALTGNRLEDHPTLVNLLWEQRNRPASYKRIFKALSIDGFITLKLTGNATLHHSGAAFYGVAYDLRLRCFNEEVLAEIGIDPAILPTLYDCTAIVGEVTAAAAAATGLAAGTPVAAGQVDCNAGWVGGGAVYPGALQCNLGTAGNFGVVHTNPDFAFSEVGRTSINFAYTVDSANTWITVPTTTTGGQSIRYLRDTFSQWEVETERVLGVSSYDLLNLQAEKIPPGAEGLIILPFLMGERTPIWDVNARGVLFGLSLNHTKGHIVRAMMEAVAFALYDSYRLISAAGLPFELPMVLNEGGAVSKLWRRIIADVFNVPLVLVKRRTGAPYGDALLAGVATGLYPSFDVARAWTEYIEPIEPDPHTHALYMEYFALYKQIYTHVKDDYKALARLRGLR